MTGCHFALSCKIHFYDFESSPLIRMPEWAQGFLAYTEKILAMPLKLSVKHN